MEWLERNPVSKVPRPRLPEREPRFLSRDQIDAVLEAVDGRVPVLVDGGIRRGTDIVKALAMGAAAVLLGRPVLWGLAVGGEEGVRSMLEMLRTELDEAMALCGCASLAQLPTDLVRDHGRPG